MATIGVSKPKYAVYEYNGETGQVTYADGGVLGKMTQVDITINTSEGNNLYADNGIAEADRQFTDGTITVGTDDLSQDVSRVILGAREAELPSELMEQIKKLPGGEELNVKELIFDDGMDTPYLGQGFIVKRQKNNVVSWRAIMLTKTLFNVPDESATTQGETIEWQTPSLVATILRDDTATHMWRRECTFPTEQMAEAYLDYLLNIQNSAMQAAYAAAGPVAVKKTTASTAGSEKV